MIEYIDYVLCVMLRLKDDASYVGEMFACFDLCFSVWIQWVVDIIHNLWCYLYIYIDINSVFYNKLMIKENICCFK